MVKVQELKLLLVSGTCGNDFYIMVFELKKSYINIIEGSMGSRGRT